jgi:hypothetical protein
MYKVLILSLFVMVMASFGCAASGLPYGVLYTNTYVPVQATNNSGVTRQGQSCMTTIFFLITTGDASTTAAAKAGGVSRIANVNVHTTSLLGLYTKSCTLVVGD